MIALQQEREASILYDSKAATIYDIAKGKSKYRKQFLAYENIERANKPKNPTAVTSVIGGHGVNLVSVVAQKLRGGRTEFVANSKYIAKITGKKRRQNINIINQINGTAFKVTSHKKYKNQRNCYVFTHLENTLKTDESRVQNFAQCQSLQMARVKDEQGYYKNNNTRSIRSNVQAYESIILQNSSSLNLEEVSKVIPLKPKPICNKRKKPTNAEVKANKAKVHHFNQYKEPQDLAYHYPLNNEDCSKLQTKSGRMFCLTAINEILLDMSKRVDRTFCSKAKFIAYFAKCLSNEKRDAVKTDNINFRIKANITQEERNTAKREAILSREEYKAYDLENRSTEGFQSLSVSSILDKLQIC